MDIKHRTRIDQKYFLLTFLYDSLQNIRKKSKYVDYHLIFT